MTYHIEPVENSGRPGRIDWLIELEVGSGLCRNVATITDMTTCKTSPTRNGTVAYHGGKTLYLPLDEPPTTSRQRPPIRNHFGKAISAMFPVNRQPRGGLTQRCSSVHGAGQQ
jgi:hypothetical protein